MNNSSQAIRFILAVVGIVLFAGIGAGLVWLALTTDQSVGVLLTFAAGLSMIFLPCTLPLIFIIVPMTLGKSPHKGFIMAVLFGLGISITLAVYGIIVSQIGDYLGLDMFTRYMFLVAGVIAIIFGWSELGLIRVSLPEFMGASPRWLQNKGEYAKALGMGVLLGNAGVGCPNPAFYVILTYIATVGSVEVGAGLGFIHGLGRAVPLLAIVILAILGVNTTKWVAARKDSINKVMGWALVIVGAFILTYGLLGMQWWEESVFHAGWNELMLSIAPALAEAPNHPVAQGVLKGPVWLGWWMWIGIVLISMAWRWVREKHASAKQIGTAVVLALLGVAASTGIIQVEHGHRLEGDLERSPAGEHLHEHEHDHSHE